MIVTAGQHTIHVEALLCSWRVSPTPELGIDPIGCVDPRSGSSAIGHGDREGSSEAYLSSFSASTSIMRCKVVNSSHGLMATFRACLDEIAGVFMGSFSALSSGTCGELRFRALTKVFPWAGPY